MKPSPSPRKSPKPSKRRMSRDHPPRSETGQHQAAAGWCSEGPGLRAREGDGRIPTDPDEAAVGMDFSGAFDQLQNERPGAA